MSSSEPLYQIYQAKVLKEASQIQSDSPDCNRRSVSETLGLEGPGGLGVVGTRFKRGPDEITLWQDLPVVKESGVLHKLTRTEKQRQESMFEVLTSEASYLRSLRVLKDHFLGSRELNETLVIHDRRALFSNLLQVYEVSERFIGDLLKRVDESVVISDVCDIIYEHSENHFSVFIDYVRNQQYQEKTYSRLMESNRDFSLVMRRLESSPLCKHLPFTSFMLLPFQRITRIKILIQVRYLYILLMFSKNTCSSNFSIKCEMIRQYRNKCIPVYMFLFNDLLILTKKKRDDIFVENNLGPRLDHCFCLTLLENHRGNTYCPQVQCVSQYVAKQADELSLEPSDVFNMLRKTSEGWYEGMRLSDGKKGWFPAENTSEVTTDHQRRRNVREKYQIAQATSQNTPS
uniref:Rho guanine nucleotide exchange factor (GEF) 15 n=1 Tax=Sinocyclocheilus anshuiensis TaxID=1608454 RepID=A0A671KG19_9TELE